MGYICETLDEIKKAKFSITQPDTKDYLMPETAIS